MNKKAFQIATPITAALTLLFALLERVLFASDFFSALTPLLFVATLIGGYFLFKDTVSFDSKWVWVVLVILLTTTLSLIANVLYLLFKQFAVLPLISNVLRAGGFCLISFCIVSPLISTVVIQDKINKIVGKPQ